MTARRVNGLKEAQQAWKQCRCIVFRCQFVAIVSVGLSELFACDLAPINLFSSASVLTAFFDRLLDLDINLGFKKKNNNLGL